MEGFYISKGSYRNNFYSYRGVALLPNLQKNQWLLSMRKALRHSIASLWLEFLVEFF